jgi:hypothetical protein
MITVGMLFLLDEFTRYSFHRTWPIILIAIGAALIAQRALPSSTDSQTTIEKR